jgi:hypothetical protein
MVISAMVPATGAGTEIHLHRLPHQENVVDSGVVADPAIDGFIPYR